MIGEYTNKETLDEMKNAVIEALETMKSGVALDSPASVITKAEYRTYLENKITEAYLNILDRLGEFSDD